MAGGDVDDNVIDVNDDESIKDCYFLNIALSEKFKMKALVDTASMISIVTSKVYSFLQKEVALKEIDGQ